MDAPAAFRIGAHREPVEKIGLRRLLGYGMIISAIIWKC